jgi:hypothetical protein
MLSIHSSIISIALRIWQNRHHHPLLLGIAFACVIIGCQPTPEPNKPSPSSDSTKKSTTDGSVGKGEETKSETKTSSDEGKSAESNKKTETPIADSDEVAKRLITECVANYGSLKSYEDEAILHLSIPLANAPVLANQPLRIAFERPNKLAIHAQSLRSMWTTQTFESVVDAGPIAVFDNQRVVRPLPESIQ